MYRKPASTAARGREPDLRLERRDGGALFDWALEIIDQCKPIAAAVGMALRRRPTPPSLADARDQSRHSARHRRMMLEDDGSDFDQS